MDGGNALSIAQKAVAYKNANEKKVDEYWVLFDKDDATDQQFTQAIQLALDNNIRVAWSNQAFGCWIILHYRHFQHPCHRYNYENILKQYIPGYDSNEKGEEQGKQLYRLTINLLKEAIERAKNGYATFDVGLPAAQNKLALLYMNWWKISLPILD